MSLKSRVETVLFVTAKAISSQEIAEILNENIDKVYFNLKETKKGLDVSLQEPKSADRKRSTGAVP